VGVVDRGVHHGAAAGGDAVCRVADEERVSVAVAVCHLGGERERARPQDAWLEVGYAGCGPDQAHRLCLGVLPRVGSVRLELLAVQPAVTGPARDEDAFGLRAGDDVEAEAALTDDISHRRLEQRGGVVDQTVGPHHGDAEQIADRAVRAVGSDHEARPDQAGASGRRVAERSDDAVVILLEADHFGPEADWAVR
jgi:hypothetical protein